MRGLRGLATGIGSLPHEDPEIALDLIFKFLPNIPFWPQLSKVNIREGMVAQYSQNLPCLEVNESGLFFDPVDKDKKLEIFYENLINRQLDYFALSKEFACGFPAFIQRLEKSDLSRVFAIKGHVTGPFTFSASINDETGKALMHDEVFMQVIIKGLAMKALWQIEKLRKFNKKIIIFFDEPFLGSFGSAYTAVNKEDVVNAFSEITQIIKAPDVLTGVHCCGNTEWPMLTDVASLDIINFDAFGFQERFVLYAPDLNKFLKRGGIICWGVAPTQEYSDKITPAMLVEIIDQGVNALVKKGLDKELLLNNMLISPSCGLGSLDEHKAEQILPLLSETSLLLQK